MAVRPSVFALTVHRQLDLYTSPSLGSILLRLRTGAGKALTVYGLAKLTGSTRRQVDMSCI